MMNSKRIAFLLVIAMVLFMAPMESHGLGSDGIQYQGYLTNSSGQPFEGQVDFVFSIYGQATGGSAIWSESTSVTVDQGVYNVTLGGPGNPFPQGMFLTPLWLGVQVDQDPEMSPRQPLTAVPFAFNAQDSETVQGVDAAAKLAELEARIVALESFHLCGNGQIDAGEDCDDGAANGTTICGCTNDCTLATALTECRPSTGPCDVAESCDGAGACPADTFLPSSTECRAAVDTCDAAEYCTGSSADCPVDAVQPASVICRSQLGDCDVAETCDGVNYSCPADSFRSAAYMCRPQYSECDAAEYCTGSSVDCPADSYAPAGASCGDPTNTECKYPDVCNGLGTCLSNYAPAGTSCGDPTNTECKYPDACDGLGTCLSNYAPAGASCGDQANTECTNPDACNGLGTCLSNDAPDSTPCTGGTCQGGACVP